MKLRLRAALLIFLAMAAAKTGLAAYKSIQPTGSVLPADIYEKYSRRRDEAVYCLKICDGYVAVYDAKRARAPLSMTGIESTALRRADRAMLEKGIPVDSHTELLELLEDLGS